jgi:hypothetical protein
LSVEPVSTEEVAYKRAPHPLVISPVIRPSLDIAKCKAQIEE